MPSSRIHPPSARESVGRPTLDDALDSVVVGGGPAGLSAALTLGRARRRVLVASHGPTRNAPAEAAHGVFTRDGTPPAELVRIGREQLAPYAVTVRDEAVTGVTPDGNVFALEVGDDRVLARTVVLATGLRDVLPDVPGMAELWGTGVFHCPFCHGWEVGGRPLALYGRGAAALHLSALLPLWSRDLVLFTDGPAELDGDARAQVERHGVRIREERVERLDGQGGRLEAVVLRGGERVPRAGLFLSPAQEKRSDLAGTARVRAAGRRPHRGRRVRADVGAGRLRRRRHVAGDAAGDCRGGERLSRRRRRRARLGRRCVRGVAVLARPLLR